MKGRFVNAVSEQVYQYLIDMILSLQIHPGDKIPEASIAQQFHISRTPIREALRELAKEGIINLYPKRFAEVAIFDEKKVRDIGITKICLDRLALKLAIYYGSRAEYDSLRKYAQQCYEAAKQGDEMNRIKADSDFHWALCEMGKNYSLIELENNILLQIEYLQAANYLQAEDPTEQYHAHMEIIQALEDGNLEKALEAITKPSIQFYNLKGLPPSLYQ